MIAELCTLREQLRVSIVSGDQISRDGIASQIRASKGIDVVSDDEIRIAFESILEEARESTHWVATSPAREQHDVPGASGSPHDGSEA